MTGKISTSRWLWTIVFFWSPIVQGPPHASAADCPKQNSGDDVQVAEQGWGDLLGRFVYVASPHDIGERLSFVDPTTGGIKGVVVYEPRISRVHELLSTDARGAPAPVTLQVERNTFVPRVVPMRLSETLLLKNTDTTPHIFLIRPPLDQETNVLLGPGDRFRVTFRIRHLEALVRQGHSARASCAPQEY